MNESLGATLRLKVRTKVTEDCSRIRFCIKLLKFYSITDIMSTRARTEQTKPVFGKIESSV